MILPKTGQHFRTAEKNTIFFCKVYQSLDKNTLILPKIVNFSAELATIWKSENVFLQI